MRNIFVSYAQHRDDVRAIHAAADNFSDEGFSHGLSQLLAKKPWMYHYSFCQLFLHTRSDAESPEAQARHESSYLKKDHSSVF
jgi:hypothetical protein